MLGAVLACSGLGACGASLPTSAEKAASETAETVCAELRDSNNDLTEVFNATSAAITDADDPATSVDVLVGGFDDMIAVAEADRDDLDDLDLPTVDERDDRLEGRATAPDHHACPQCGHRDASRAQALTRLAAAR